jgi:spore coat protein A
MHIDWSRPRVIRVHLFVKIALLASASLLAKRVEADQVTLSPVKDTTIYEGSDPVADGRGYHLFAGFTADHTERRALLAFDVTRSLPPGATVRSATLGLTLTRTQPSTSDVSIHRLLAAWGEGSSRASGNEGGGAPASEGDATWACSAWPADAWNSPGGDFEPSLSATLTVAGTGAYQWTSADLARDVQSFLDQPDTNNGWILVGTGTAKRFDSRESGGTGPTLDVVFDPPPMTGACCFADGGCGESLAGGCDGKFVGTGTACGLGVCPEPVGACCTPDAKATCDEIAVSQCQGSFRGGGTTCDPNPCPVVLTPFVDPLPLPVVATPVDGNAGGAAAYHLKLVQLEQQLHHDLPPTTVWGFDDGHARGYPGPTIEARSGEPIEVTWENDLRGPDGKLLAKHALAVDHCLEGADTDAPRSVIHLHGGHVPPEADGYPEWTLLPGEQKEFDYPNEQRAATLWYHDHAMGITRLNVYMGLAGFYLLRDDEEAALALPHGDHEIPIVIQDRSFNPDGSLRYPAEFEESFFGDNLVVNGKVSPFLHVDHGSYRFRLLNGSTSRTYTLALSNGYYFYLVGNDGGLLPESYPTHSLTLMPGERADIVVEFRYMSDSVVLKNSAVSPFPGGGSGPDLTDVLKFIVDDAPGVSTPVPMSLSKITSLPEKNAARTRDFALDRVNPDDMQPAAMPSDPQCAGSMFEINDHGWDEIDEKPHLGTTEIWRFINHTGITHPMHLHGVSFQVLDRQSGHLSGEDVIPQGDPQQPDPLEAGWKDTVEVGPFEIVRVLVPFDDFAGDFPYHCHLIEHEDHGMMRQYEAVAVCGDGALAKRYEECDDGNRRDGDGCDHACKLETAQSAAGGQAGEMSGAASGTEEAGTGSGAGGAGGETSDEGGSPSAVVAGAPPEQSGTEAPPSSAPARSRHASGGGCALVPVRESDGASGWIALALCRLVTRRRAAARGRRANAYC